MTLYVQLCTPLFIPYAQSINIYPTHAETIQPKIGQDKALCKSSILVS